MTRRLRVAVAAVAVAGALAPATPAFAEPDPPSFCRLYWEPIAQTTPGFPVPLTIYAPRWVC